MNIFENPATIAATISSCIAFTGIVTQTLLTLTKNKNDIRSNFEKVLSEKLSEMYTPLQMLLHQKHSINISLIDEEITALLSKNNHLLSNDLLEDLLELVQIEKSMHIDEVYIEEEHISLKEKILIRCREEFSELQSIQNRHFERYKKRFNTNWFDRTGLVSITTILSVTVLYWLIALLMPSIRQTEHWWELLVIVLQIIISVGTLMSLFIGAMLLLASIEYMKYRINKKKTSFFPKNYVPETAIYQCTICSFKTRKVRHRRFDDCDQKHGWTKKILALATIYSWKRVRE